MTIYEFNNTKFTGGMECVYRDNKKYLVCSVDFSEQLVGILLSDNENSKKLVKEINYCIENKIKFMFVIGENEYANNKIILKNLENKTQEIIDLS